MAGVLGVQRARRAWTARHGDCAQGRGEGARGLHVGGSGLLRAAIRDSREFSRAQGSWAARWPEGSPRQGRVRCAGPPGRDAGLQGGSIEGERENGEGERGWGELTSTARNRHPARRRRRSGRRFGEAKQWWARTAQGTRAVRFLEASWAVVSLKNRTVGLEKMHSGRPCVWGRLTAAAAGAPCAVACAQRAGWAAAQSWRAGPVEQRQRARDRCARSLGRAGRPRAAACTGLAGGGNGALGRRGGGVGRGARRPREGGGAGAEGKKARSWAAAVGRAGGRKRGKGGWRGGPAGPGKGGWAEICFSFSFLFLTLFYLFQFDTMRK
jgi:hypothetical protein